MMKVFVDVQGWLKLTWCYINWGATAFWKASESAVKDSPTEWSTRNSNSGELWHHGYDCSNAAIY